MITFEQALISVKSPELHTPTKGDIAALRINFQLRFPSCIKALKIIDDDYKRPRKVKGYNLVKRDNKKQGFVYYVRYMDSGKMLPSMWCTHTNILDEAEEFAIENRERLVNEYKTNHLGLSSFFDILEKYYEKGSEYLESESRRKKALSEHQRGIYYNLVKKRFIPFLKEKGIYAMRDITAPIITGFQNRLLDEGLKPQTTNSYLCGINKILSHFAEKGVLKDNPFNVVSALAVRPEDRKMRGCHELSKLNGVFNGSWEDRYSQLLMMLIYSTDLRNSELEKIRLNDIEDIDGCKFIRVKQSKSANGIRLAPLHEFVYKWICNYAREKELENDAYLVTKKGKKIRSPTYKKANIDLSKRLGISVEELEKENLTFYSGRHFWKTLMNSEGLGADIEEIFMGHRVSGDVAKRYNHKDKRGKERMLEAARKVYKILDENLFSEAKQGILPLEA